MILSLYDLILVGALVLKGFCKEDCKGLPQMLEKRILNRNLRKVHMGMEDSSWTNLKRGMTGNKSEIKPQSRTVGDKRISESLEEKVTVFKA